MNSEVNDQALEGVSGGISEGLIQQAKNVCGHCHYHNDGHCPVSIEEFAEYMRKTKPVDAWFYCPLRPCP